MYRQRLRYIAARYGWRTNIQSWEIWNETYAPTPWLREMAEYLKGTGPFAGQPADPFKHLVSTTWTDDDGWKIPEFDFTQSHIYGNGAIPDLSFQMAQDAEDFATYNKPHLVAEFGTDVGGQDAKLDPEGKGVNMHNAIWAAAVSGDAGSAMTWWWDNYIDPKESV